MFERDLDFREPQCRRCQCVRSRHVGPYCVHCGPMSCARYRDPHPMLTVKIATLLVVIWGLGLMVWMITLVAW